ncbi:hypothetical protein HY419_01225 [candidate division WWE3 bacterium]|nr:hypothetical protein [candidate division WWE3 bacterium]
MNSKNLGSVVKDYWMIVLAPLVAGLFIGYVYFNFDALKTAFVGVRVRDVKFAKLSDSSVRVTFKTSKPVSAMLKYGTTQLYGVETEENAVSADHTFNLVGLLPGKGHNFQIVMKDETGKVKLSSNYIIKAN